MRSHIVQSNFTGGVVSEEYQGNVQSEEYYKSLKQGTNVVIAPNGGIKRRGGLRAILDETSVRRTSLYLDDYALVRIEPFFVNEDKKFIIGIYVKKTGILRFVVFILYDEAGNQVSIASSPELDLDEQDILNMQIVQSVDVMIMFRGKSNYNYAPFQITRNPTDDSISYGVVTFLNEPKYNFTTKTIDYDYTDPSSVTVWTSQNDFPRYGTFFQGRLWVAGNNNFPMTVWGSQLNDFFDFDTNTGDTNALWDNLEYQYINPITGIFGGRNLQVFTTGTEFINTADPITQSNSIWTAQSNFGSSAVQPVSIDGSVYFVDRTGINLRYHIYRDDEKGFTAIQANRKATSLVNDVKSMAFSRGNSFNVSNYLICVNGDGTVAVMNTLREAGINAWTKWETEFGLFKQVITLDDNIYFLVERNGIGYIERIDDNVTMDFANTIELDEPVTYSVTHFGDNVTHLGTFDVVHTVGATTTATSIQTNYQDSFILYNNSDIENSRKLTLKLDGNVQGKVNITDLTGENTNQIDFSREAYKAEVGINFSTTIETLPLNIPTQTGHTVNRRKRIIRTLLNLLDSKGVIIRSREISNRSFPIPLDAAAPLFTGVKEVYLSGYGRIVTLEIKQEQPFPMTVLSIDTEVEV